MARKTSVNTILCTTNSSQCGFKQKHTRTGRQYLSKSTRSLVTETNKTARPESFKTNNHTWMICTPTRICPHMNYEQPHLLCATRQTFGRKRIAWSPRGLTYCRFGFVVSVVKYTFSPTNSSLVSLTAKRSRIRIRSAAICFMKPHNLSLYILYHSFFLIQFNFT